MNFEYAAAQNNIIPDELFNLARSAFLEIDFEIMMCSISSEYEDHPVYPENKYLSPGEKEKLHSYKMEKRRREFLGGRLCAKEAAMALLTRNGITLPPTDIYVGNEPSGRPVLESLSHSCSVVDELDVSITHSKALAGAIVSKNYCGIDIQEEKQTLERVQKRFCTNREIQMIESAAKCSSSLSALNIVWTIKEAVRKTYSKSRVPEFHDIQIHHSLLHEKEVGKLACSLYGKDVVAVYGIIPNYVVALCIDG